MRFTFGAGGARPRRTARLLGLDQPGNVTLPIAGSAGLAVVAALAAPVGGLAMRRTVERASNPAREQE